MLIYAVMGMGLFFTWMSSRRRDILISMTAGLIWFVLGMWIFFSSTPILGLDESWKQILVWIFFILTFVPFLIYMNQEITREKSGNRWTEYGNPKDYEETVSSYDNYKKELQRRIRRHRRY